MKKVRQTSIKKASYLIQPNDCRKSVQGPSECDCYSITAEYRFSTAKTTCNGTPYPGPKTGSTYAICSTESSLFASVVSYFAFSALLAFA